MASIEIYTKAWCPYCIRAKQLLESKGVLYQEIPIDGNPKRAKEMHKRSKESTVPQIFIDSERIGGSDDLFAANESGHLDVLLGIDAQPATNQQQTT